MTKEAIFRGVIRFVFLFAYGAFLWASIHHVATFFDNFEPGETDWTGSYTLAISIDATALVLTVGVMFFRKSMPGLALGVVWFFIFALTAFSWLVNWEYAMRYQSNDLTIDPLLKLLNPVLASSFAFLNLAYSVVAEFFNTKKQSAEDLAKEADRLEALATQQSRLDAAKARMRKRSMIERAKELAIEAKSAAKEVIGERRERKESPPLPNAPLPEKLEQTLQFLSEHPELVDHWVAGSDEQLAAYLGLHRKASARFWRLKALELWPAYTRGKRSRNAGPLAVAQAGASEGEIVAGDEEEMLEYTASSRGDEPSGITRESTTGDESEDQQGNAEKPSASAPTSRRPATPASVTVKEAAAMLGLSETYVRELRSTKKLRSPGRNKKLILVNSIKAYQAAREKAGQNGSHKSQENDEQKENSNGHAEAAIPLEEYEPVTA
jgi:Helix-turn-helix domain